LTPYDPDLYAAACDLIEEYGDEAVSYAELMVDATEDGGDPDSGDEWRGLLTVVCQIIEQRGRRLH
jgi:hypothetical protein